MKFGVSLFGCFHPSSKSSTFPSNASQGEEVCKLNAGTDGETATNSDFRVFSYSELKSATQGFAHKIGQGGFGFVYKGRLVGGDFVAVKVLSVELESLRGEREFISELTALSDIEHENLVTLRGCCINGADRFWSMISWKTAASTILFSVSLGIARGLCYLHQEISPHHIVHRDIKASNILLDHNFIPKIADFGLAKLFKDDMSHITTRVAGTLGYLSPEYAHSGHLTRKSDVYSFGVLLLEIVSGRPVVDYHLKYGEQFIVEKAWEQYNSKNLEELVDFVIEGDYSRQEGVRFLEVGLLCVQETTKLRPEMCVVVKMLTGEIDTKNVEISWPGIVADLMEVKIRQKNSSIFSFIPATSSSGSLQA